MASLNLTLRQRKLLHTIQNRKDMITGQELAGLLNASARTIRSDVVTINHELKPYGASIDSVRSSIPLWRISLSLSWVLKSEAVESARFWMAAFMSTSSLK